MMQRIRAISQGEYDGKKKEEENKDRSGDREECRTNGETGKEKRKCTGMKGTKMEMKLRRQEEGRYIGR